MTIVFPSRTSGPYTATEGQKQFNYGFRIDDAAEQKVFRLRGDVETLLVYPTD